MSHCRDISTYPPYIQEANKKAAELGPIWIQSVDEAAKVDPFAFRSSNTVVREGAVVAGDTMLTGNAEVQEGALVSAEVHVGGDSIVGKHAKIETPEHYMTGQIFGFWFDAHRTHAPGKLPCVTMRFGCRSMCLAFWTREACQAAAYEMAGYAHEDLAAAIEDIVSAAESLIGGAMKRERLKEDK